MVGSQALVLPRPLFWFLVVNGETTCYSTYDMSSTQFHGKGTFESSTAGSGTAGSGTSGSDSFGSDSSGSGTSGSSRSDSGTSGNGTSGI